MRGHKGRHKQSDFFHKRFFSFKSTPLSAVTPDLLQVLLLLRTCTYRVHMPLTHRGRRCRCAEELRTTPLPLKGLIPAPAIGSSPERQAGSRAAMGNQHRLTSLGLSPTAGCTVTRTLAVWSPSSASSTVPLLPARLARISSFSVEMPAARAALRIMEAGVGLSTRARDRARVGAGVEARVGLGSWLRLGVGSPAHRGRVGADFHLEARLDQPRVPHRIHRVPDLGRSARRDLCLGVGVGVGEGRGRGRPVVHQTARGT